MAVTPPVSLAEFKAHLHLPVTADSERDPVLTRKLAAATELVEARVGVMVQRNVAEQAYAEGRVLVLTEGPLVSVTAVTDVQGAAVAVDSLEVDQAARMLVFAGPGPVAGPYDVAYAAGHGATQADVPAALKEATLLVAEQLYQSARGPVPQSKYTENGSTPPRGFAWPHRAKELCKPYADVWVAA